MKKLLLVLGFVILGGTTVFAQEPSVFKAVTPDGAVTSKEQVQVEISTNINVKRKTSLAEHQKKIEELTQERDRLNTILAQLQAEIPAIQLEAEKVKLATPSE